MINQQFPLAVHLLAVLAYRGGRVDSRALAASMDTHPVVVRRLLGALRRADLVATTAGKGGGATLTRPPARVTLRDIYDAVEPPAVIPCTARRVLQRCPVSCGMKTITARLAMKADDALRRELRRTTLADLIREIR